MTLNYNQIISQELINHAKLSFNNGEEVSYYIDQTSGLTYLDRYITISGIEKKYTNDITIVNSKHDYKKRGIHSTSHTF